MTIYRSSPDIVLTVICGEYMLVATKKADDRCPYLNGMNETGAFIWKKLKNGCTINQLADALYEEYDLPDIQTAAKEISEFIVLLDENHYLITEETE